MNEFERIERRISLHDMRVLRSVVEAGSMSKAARRLATSQLRFQGPLPISNMRLAFVSWIAVRTEWNRLPTGVRSLDVA
jgi:hypothetical protein